MRAGNEAHPIVRNRREHATDEAPRASLRIARPISRSAMPAARSDLAFSRSKVVVDRAVADRHVDAILRREERPRLRHVGQVQRIDRRLAVRARRQHAAVDLTVGRRDGDVAQERAKQFAPVVHGFAVERHLDAFDARRPDAVVADLPRVAAAFARIVDRVADRHVRPDARARLALHETGLLVHEPRLIGAERQREKAGGEGDDAAELRDPRAPALAALARGLGRLVLFVRIHRSRPRTASPISYRRRRMRRESGRVRVRCACALRAASRALTRSPASRPAT